MVIGTRRRQGSVPSVSKAAYTNIDNVGAQYDQETEHGTNGDKQKEWQGKYN